MKWLIILGAWFVIGLIVAIIFGRICKLNEMPDIDEVEP